MTGTVNIARALWDDPTFRDSEMSQREAWIWLIAQASWRPRIKRIDTKEIELARAQVAASTRFLARAWKWSEPKVRRYLDMLENRRKIKRAIDAGVTVITICKYDKYQSKPRDGDAAPTQQPTQDRRTADANEDKGETRIKKEEGARAREAEFFEKLRTAVCLDPTSPPSRYWQDEAIEPWVTRWRKVGLTDDQILAEAKASRAKNPEPPEGPKALNGWMMQAATNRTAASAPTPEVAKAQAAPKPPMSPEKRLEFWAEKINGPQVVPPSAISSWMRNALIASGMVTEAKMRERGL